DAKQIVCGSEVETGVLPEVVDHLPTIVIARVQSGSNRRRAEIELEKLGGRVVDVVRAALHARRVAAKFLPERHGHRILKMRSTRLDDAGKLPGFSLEGVNEIAGGIDKPPVSKEQGKARRRWVHVVGRLSHVHVIVRVNAFVGATRFAEQLRSA